MLYEGYRCSDGSLAMLPSTHTQDQKSALLGQNPTLIWTFTSKRNDLEGWTEAMVAWHEFNGWEPYRPFDEK